MTSDGLHVHVAGSRCEVKVIDLGSSCFITDHLSSYVQSRSYRAPEVILGLAYGQKIDLWSLGCILAELATGYVLFQVGSTPDTRERPAVRTDTARGVWAYNSILPWNYASDTCTYAFVRRGNVPNLYLLQLANCSSSYLA